MRYGLPQIDAVRIMLVMYILGPENTAPAFRNLWIDSPSPAGLVHGTSGIESSRPPPLVKILYRGTVVHDFNSSSWFCRRAF